MADNSLQKNSSAYRLPALDTDFLLGDSMRGVRLQLEYEKAEQRLRAWTVRSTVVVFGSARVLPQGSGEPASLPRHCRSAAPRPDHQSARWYEEARRFGRIVSERGGALIADHGVRDNVIATGGGPGIMEAANRGASDAGAPSIGFNIGLPREQAAQCLFDTRSYLSVSLFRLTQAPFRDAGQRVGGFSGRVRYTR